MTAELVVDARNAVGESPVWHAAENSLYWVDIPARQMHRWQASGDSHTTWSTPEMIGCIAVLGDGRWLGAGENGLFQLQPGEAGAMQDERIAQVSHAQPGMRFNDGRCDRQGRFRAGTMAMDMGAARAVGKFYAFDDGALTALVEDLLVPNGLAFSPDGSTMYLSDSHPLSQTIWAFDYDTASGQPSNRRVFVDMKPLPGRPDGAAVDADGCYWICANDAGLVHRFTPAGELDRSLAVPVLKPAMCAFGGSGLDTLFVTSIRPGGIDLSGQPLAGGVFALQPGVRGLPEPMCLHRKPDPPCKETT